MNNSEFSSVADLLKSNATPGPSVINPFVRPEGKYGPLLDPAHAKSSIISKDVRSFSLDQPAYVVRIEIIADDAKAIADWMSFTIKKVDGSTLTPKPVPLVGKNTDGTQFPYAVVNVNAFCTRIDVKSVRKKAALKAKRVRVVGYTISQFEILSSKLKSFNGIVAGLDEYVQERHSRVESAEKRLAEVTSSIDAVTSQLEDLGEQRLELESATNEVRTQNVEATKKKTGLDQEIVAVNQRIETAKNNESTLRETIEGLNRDIVRKGGELRALVNDRNLISDEYGDYVAEGKKQSRTYVVFLFLCIGVIGYCSWQLYTGAQKILYLDQQSAAGITALLMQRLPFAAAVGLIVTVTWKLAALFVSRIMVIHSQRLALARLLVIAKDTVFSSVSELKISDESKFRERIRLKLAMLRAHLTSELGRDFEYDSLKGPVDGGLDGEIDEDDDKP